MPAPSPPVNSPGHDPAAPLNGHAAASARPVQGTQTPHRLDAVDRLAAAKRLDAAELRKWGVSARVDAVLIPYLDETGEPLYTRERRPPQPANWDPAKEYQRFHTPKGSKARPYGLWRLDEGRRSGTLYLVEGESDAWAMWHAGRPTLGMPGNTSYGCLTADHIVGIQSIYVSQDRRGGEAFVAGIKTRLVELNYAGRLAVLTMPPGIDNDLSDLWAESADRQAFIDALTDIESSAPEIMSPPTREPEEASGADEAEAQVGWTWSPITTAQLFDAPAPEWLVEGHLVVGQPAVMGGPLKTFKTSVALDLAISLSEGTPFLGMFKVPKKRRVAVISGESGQWTIGQTVRRVCGGREIDPAHLSISWLFDLPRMTNEDHMSRLREGLVRDGIEVVFLDPLYLCLLGGQTDVKAENLFQMGPLLLNVSRACLRAGTTPMILHHSGKAHARKYEPPELTDLAFAGIGEFARQWLLLGWRERYDPGSARKLWYSASGSVGHGGLWALDVHEGQIGSDFGGRVWDVDVRPASEEIEMRKCKTAGERTEKTATKEQEQERAFLAAMDARTKNNEPVAYNQIRDAAGLSSTIGTRVLARLIARKIVEEVPDFRVKIGSKATREARGIRRCDDSPY